MVRSYYTAGFLYHPETQQVLLQQKNPGLDWEMFGGESDMKDPQAFFEKMMIRVLGNISGVKKIYPVYSYFNASMHKTHYIYYAIVARLKNYHSRTGETLAWFNFKQVAKLALSAQAKHDIVVAGRVIAAQARADEPRVGLEPTT
ncbi:hypothetical protein HYS82_00280 [Candidatus Amesbacteria bacterium]|nr:hypothetical protein [Candidatus Amesbacteria bacterium]MBI2587387.1 hypothetical protein [Candidatus Amesbacteria bacterium]